MSINIGFDFKNGTCFINNSADNNVSLSSYEADGVAILMNLLSEVPNSAKVHLEKRADDYISIVCGEHNDFVRLKLTDRTKWISIRLAEEDRLSNIDNPIFSAQKNKNQSHWKIKLDTIEQIKELKKFICQACYDY
ncbi:hypothetical protein [Hungatella hathewayi]|uniref:hypothetical protein n=1 Tax=Hungatella hathewayi TaxID=154046 RepID=UPI003563BA96